MRNKLFDGSEVYVVARLINDLEIMAILEAEDAKFVKLSYAMEVRMVPTVNDEGIRSYSKFAAMPLTQFSDEPDFVISKDHILFIKKLSSDMKEHYRSIISAPEDLEDLELDWDELDAGEEEEMLDLMESKDKKMLH